MAIALASTFSLSACSSSDEVTSDNAEPNPTYDGTSVRTDFAFNITKASQTRMSAVNTQNNNNFLGMTDMYLLPFDGEPGTGTDQKTTTNLSNSPKNYPLGSLLTADIVPTGDNQNSKKIYSLTIPVGTNNFLFYAKANHGSSTNFLQGRLSSSFFKASGDKVTSPTKAEDVSNINDIHFDLQPIETSLGVDATNIADYLTKIAKADDGETPPTDNTWAGSVIKAATDANYSSLADLYTKFTKNVQDYSGSTESIQRLVFDLYKSAYAINAQSSHPTVVKIAKNICTKIENSQGTVKLEVKNGTTEVKISATEPVSANTAGSWTATLSGPNSSFPSNLSLPMGAALIKWVSGESNQFVYGDNPLYASSSVTSLGESNDLSEYSYPAEIIYFNNSPLRATNKYKTADEFPSTTSTWDITNAENASSGFTSDWSENSSVQATTRAVAMTNNVNYGVALLKTDVQLESVSLTDNMKKIVGAAENQIITAANSKNDASKNSVFKVTGILIGGQPGQVGWNMTKTNSSAFNKVIYDNDVTFSNVPLSMTKAGETGSSPVGPNYTIVLDNYKAGEGAQDNVRIALQIVNEGVDFYGVNGLIPAGSTFYLIGTLDMTSKSWTKAGRKDTYRIPFESTGRVFCQDYTATANITLKADALSRAYSAIPDLRSTEVLFGLSVDLTWQSGLEFNVDM